MVTHNGGIQQPEKAPARRKERASRTPKPNRLPSLLPATRTDPAARQYSVLVVDDHQSFRRSLCAFLGTERKWHVCAEAVNGRDGVEQALRIHPDVILMDISMPEMDGIEASRVLHCDLPATPIIILSANDSREMIEVSINAGVSGYVTKRDLARDLFRALDTVLQGERFIGESSG